MIISIAIVLFIDDKSFLCDQCYTKTILSVAVSGFFTIVWAGEKCWPHAKLLDL